MDEKRKTKKIWIIIIIGVPILLLLLPTSFSEPYQKLETYQEPYIVKEDYQVQVPYNDLEYYTEKEPFVDTKYKIIDFVYKADYTSCVGRVPLVNEAKVTVTVNNFDTQGGTFKLWVGLILPDGNKIGQEVSKYIYPSQSADFTYSSNSEISQCTYNIVTIPTKNLSETFTNYRDVQKSRTVINYRTETQRRDVTKTRSAQRYVTDYKEVNVLMFQRILGLY